MNQMIFELGFLSQQDFFIFLFLYRNSGRILFTVYNKCKIHMNCELNSLTA